MLWVVLWSFTIVAGVVAVGDPFSDVTSHLIQAVGRAPLLEPIHRSSVDKAIFWICVRPLLLGVESAVIGAVLFPLGAPREEATVWSSRGKLPLRFCWKSTFGPRAVGGGLFPGDSCGWFIRPTLVLGRCTDLCLYTAKVLLCRNLPTIHPEPSKLVLPAWEL